MGVCGETLKFLLAERDDALVRLTLTHPASSVCRETAGAKKYTRISCALFSSHLHSQHLLELSTLNRFF